MDTAAASPLAGAERRRSLAAVLASVYGIGAAIGLASPLVALTVTDAGHSAAMAGLVSAAYSGGILLGSRLVGRGMRRVGAAQALAIGLAIGGAGFLIFPLTESLLLWFAIRIAMGFGTVFDWAISETWINSLAAPARRGRTIGLYATIFAGGIATGPVILSVTGTGTMLPFLIGAGIQLASMGPVLAARRLAPRLDPDSAGIAWRPLVRRAPLVFAAAGLCGLVETAMIALLAVYARAVGIAESAAVLQVTLFGIGGILLQPLVGWAADRVDRRRLVHGAALLFVAAALLLPATAGRPALAWPILFLAGGAVASFYTVGLILLGERFRSHGLAEANTLFILCYTAGSVVGPAVAGGGMALWAPHGFVIVLAAVTLLFLAAAPRLSPAPTPEE